MAKADELEKRGQISEAWMKVIRYNGVSRKSGRDTQRKAALSDKFGTPSLFGAMEETTPEPTQEEEITEDYYSIDKNERGRNDEEETEY